MQDLYAALEPWLAAGIGLLCVAWLLRRYGLWPRAESARSRFGCGAACSGGCEGSSGGCGMSRRS